VSRIIRYAIVVAVLWAIWHAGLVQWRQFEFEDAIKQVAQFGADREVETVRAEVMAAAAKLGVPVVAEKVNVRREADHVYIDLTYVAPVEVFPRYFYSWTFSVVAQGWYIPGGRIPPSR
jgi:hypothetical protein